MQIANEQGMDELKRVMDAFSPLDTPAYQRTLAERPGYREFGDAKWATLSRAMWVDDVDRDPGPARPARGAGRGALPDPRARRRPRTSRSVGCREQMAATIPGAELVVIPDAGHSPQFENGAAWLTTLRELPRPRRGRVTRALTRPPRVVPARSFRRCRRRAGGTAPAPTATRVMRPAATSPDRYFTDTRNVRRRPSIVSSTASAVTDSPTATGARWSSCTRYPTVV